MDLGGVYFLVLKPEYTLRNQTILMGIWNFYKYIHKWINPAIQVVQPLD